MTSPEIRSQLKTLAIPKDRRPDMGSSRPGRTGRIIGLVFVLAAIAAGVGVYARRNGPTPLLQQTTAESTPSSASVRLFQLVRQPPPSPQPVLTATGKIVSDHRVQVSTKVSGQIVALHFEQGDRVERGQRLAQIEDTLYRARRDEAAAALDRARANLAFQRINFDRVSRLSVDEQAASIEFADALRARDEAQAQLAAAQAQLDFARKNLDDCIVCAPIGGVILERNVEVGDFVAAEGGRGANANAQFGTIADMTALRVEVDISELDVARVHHDMRCLVTPDSNKDRRYRGFVMWLDPGANYSKATVQAKVRIEAPDSFLRVEGSAQVTFLQDETEPEGESPRSAGLWIPSEACRLDESRKRCELWIVEQSRLRSRQVTVGPERYGQVPIVEGLSEGATIVAEFRASLRENQRVE